VRAGSVIVPRDVGGRVISFGDWRHPSMQSLS
jgi:hypothetical protein